MEEYINSMFIQNVFNYSSFVRRKILQGVTSIEELVDLTYTEFESYPISTVEKEIMRTIILETRCILLN